MRKFLYTGKSESKEKKFKYERDSVVNRKYVLAPKIIKPLSTVHAKIGQSIDLECVFAGYPKPSVKWFYKNQEVSPNAIGVEQSYVVAEQPRSDKKTHDQLEVFKACLSLAKVKLDDYGIYECTAANEGGSASTSANVIVADADAHTPGFMFLKLL